MRLKTKEELMGFSLDALLREEAHIIEVLGQDLSQKVARQKFSLAYEFSCA